MGRVSVERGGGGELPYVVGCYRGDSSTTRKISTPFTPSAVSVWRSDGQQHFPDGIVSQGPNYYGGFAVSGHPVMAGGQTIVRICDGGFEVFSYTYANSNQERLDYHYIAFR